MDNEMRKELIEEVTYEDLPHFCVQAAKAIGIEAYMKLSCDFGGTTLYVPKFESLVAKARDKLIIKQFAGNNYKELALKYNLTEVWIRSIVSKDQAEKNQISLFGQSVG